VVTGLAAAIVFTVLAIAADRALRAWPRRQPR
jgi:hypothetical protein